ncbi:hypothetical protein ES708_26794 [subsurface metagenome]
MDEAFQFSVVHPTHSVRTAWAVVEDPRAEARQHSVITRRIERVVLPNKTTKVDVDLYVLDSRTVEEVKVLRNLSADL